MTKKVISVTSHVLHPLPVSQTVTYGAYPQNVTFYLSKILQTTFFESSPFLTIFYPSHYPLSSSLTPLFLSKNFFQTFFKILPLNFSFYLSKFLKTFFSHR